MAASDKSRVGVRDAFGSVLSTAILILVAILAFSIRLFSVIKYESVIHEFDPYFNYRVTKYLTKSGVYDFWNWFDDRTWYPLGHVIGGPVYPGLTLTAGTMWWVFNALNIPLSVETVCVFTAPIFSANAAWATYLLTKEVKGIGAGITAAAILAMPPPLPKARSKMESLILISNPVRDLFEITSIIEGRSNLTEKSVSQSQLEPLNPDEVGEDEEVVEAKDTVVKKPVDLYKRDKDKESYDHKKQKNRKHRRRDSSLASSSSEPSHES